MRAFIVGNGESLKQTPLDLLRKEVSFACNRIHLIYHLTNWRPTYYVRTEPPAWNKSSKEFFDECRLHINNRERCIFPNWERELGNPEGVEWIKTCHHFKRGIEKAPPSWHLPYICDFGTTVTVMMQLAVLKGFPEIVLIGCDLTGKHFDKGDDGLIQTELWRKAHEIAAKSCPVPVYNATIGGSLEEYPRVNLEAYLANR